MERSRELKSGAYEVPVIDLSRAPGERAAWDRPALLVYLWGIFEQVIVFNPWQISSRLRVAVLRLFGAKIGDHVTFRPRTRVKFPWKLQLGEGCWVGDGVWIHNQDVVSVGRNVVLSQDVFITTGSHAHRRDMALLTKPVRIEDGAWVATRAIVLGGVNIGTSALISPNSVIGPNTEVAENSIYMGIPAQRIGPRFGDDK